VRAFAFGRVGRLGGCRGVGQSLCRSAIERRVAEEKIEIALKAVRHREIGIGGERRLQMIADIAFEPQVAEHGVVVVLGGSRAGCR
jgi:hypothetical protein